jgi:hypothetical protein
MKTTVDIPEQLYRQAKIRAVETGQTLKQLVLVSLSREMSRPPEVREPGVSYWANRKLLPEYEQARKDGALRPKSGDRDVTDLISEERDAR